MSVSGQNQAYRRGVLLGLTMAEVFILLLFLLLLAFVSLIEKKDQKLSELQELEKTQNRIVLIEKNKEIIDHIVNLIETNPDITQELITITEGFPKVVQEIKASELQKQGETPQQVIERALEELKIDKALEEKGSNLTPEEQLREALEAQQRLESEIANLKGQKENLMKQISDKNGGKGASYPPCWTVKDGSSPEYIFNTFLADEGIIVHDNQIPHRQSEQALLPISAITYDKPISRTSFAEQTRALLNYSNQHDCRFYVRIYDRTGADKKDLYKDLRTSVEGTFYILKIEEKRHEQTAESKGGSSETEKELPRKTREKAPSKRQYN